MSTASFYHMKDGARTTFQQLDCSFPREHYARATLGAGAGAAV